MALRMFDGRWQSPTMRTNGALSRRASTAAVFARWADGHDDACAGDEHAFAVCLLTEEAFCGDRLAGAAGVNGDGFFDHLHEDRALADVAVAGEGVCHFDEMHALALLAEVDGELTAGEAAAHDDDVVGELGRFRDNNR